MAITSEVASVPYITVNENSLTLSPEAMRMLNARAGDRITITFTPLGTDTWQPTLTHFEAPSVFGNRITKKNTVSFRGLQNRALAHYGKLFKLEPTENYNFKLILINNLQNESI